MSNENDSVDSVYLEYMKSVYSYYLESKSNTQNLIDKYLIISSSSFLLLVSGFIINSSNTFKYTWIVIVSLSFLAVTIISTLLSFQASIKVCDNQLPDLSKIVAGHNNEYIYVSSRWDCVLKLTNLCSSFFFVLGLIGVIIFIVIN